MDHPQYEPHEYVRVTVGCDTPPRPGPLSAAPPGVVLERIAGIWVQTTNREELMQALHDDLPVQKGIIVTFNADPIGEATEASVTYNQRFHSAVAAQTLTMVTISAANKEPRELQPGDPILTRPRLQVISADRNEAPEAFWDVP